MQDFIQGLPRRQPLSMFTPLKLHMDAGISLLSNGSTITLRTASGDIIDERCGLPKEFTVFCESSKPINANWLTHMWSSAFSAFMRVPEHACISFAWSKGGHLHYNVLVVFIPLNYESEYLLSRRLLSQWSPAWPWRCRVCTMTLQSTEQMIFGLSPWCDRDCSACDRTDCCGRCKVEMTGGAVKCYDCLTEEEYEQAKEMYSGDEQHPNESLRLSLLLPSRFNVNACASRSSSEASAKAGP